MNLAEMQAKFKGTVVEYLQKVKEELGEEAWKAEIKKLAAKGFQMGGPHETFWRDQIKDFDWVSEAELKAEASALPPLGKPDLNQVMAQLMKERMPGLKTQAQFTVFRATFDAFEAVVNAIFNQDTANELEFRKVLDTAFVACRQATELSRKLDAVPEASTSQAAEDFKRPPAEFQEYDIQRVLLEEAQAFTDKVALRDWYADPKNKARMNAVKSQVLRDVLMDTIRAKIVSLSPPKDAEKADAPS